MSICESVTLEFLLDTNVLSEPARPAPNPRVTKKLVKAEGRIATASVVWHELWFGCHRLPPSRRRSTLEAYLKDVIAPHVPVLGYDDAAATWHASERARLEREGKTPSFADGQIASIARVYGLVLVTANVRDFALFDELTVESWES